MITNDMGLIPNKVHLDIFAKDLDWETKEQIYKLIKHPSVVGQVAIMPDAHLGKGCTIGTTLRFGESIVPAWVGVDVGCGVLAYNLKPQEPDLPALDKLIRKAIPFGHNKRSENEGRALLSKYCKPHILHNANAVARELGGKTNPAEQIGTLGGGNHFIEIGYECGDYWLFIHSGSRHFGKTVADYHQQKAVELCKSMSINIMQGMEYLPMKLGGEDYLSHMRVAQEFATANRYVMMRIILDILGQPYNAEHYFESVHNFIGPDNICRKGAISAYEGERVVIPLNMAQGTIIGTGKGNARYNFSAPHGAGRKYGRNEAKRKLNDEQDTEMTMDEFKSRMDGIYSTSVVERNIDESPMAYKAPEDILPHLVETVDIKYFVQPIYNAKA